MITQNLKIFVFHKPSVKGHVIDFTDLSRNQMSERGWGILKPNPTRVGHPTRNDLQEWANQYDLINDPAIREEIINAFGKNNCLQTDYKEENFEVTFYEEL